LNLCTFSVALVNIPHSKHRRLKRFCQGVVDEVSYLGRCTITGVYKLCCSQDAAVNV
jgi:hypothetical protein